MERFVVGTLVEVIHRSGRRLLVDDALWVRLRDGGSGYLSYNPHTSRSGVGIVHTVDGFAGLTSLSDIEDLSDASRAWIAGYLRGNEPGIDEYLGWAGDYTRDEWDRYLLMLERYYRSGDCPPFPRRPVRPFPVTPGVVAQIRVPDWRPWAYAGERVWVEQDSRWVEAHPQPQVDEWGTLVDSVCDRRARHDHIDDAPEGWDVCADCGQVTCLPIG